MKYVINGVIMMLFRIMARNKEKTLAYAERIESFEPLGDGTVYVCNLKGQYYFADVDDITINPKIVKRCSEDWLYQIRIGDD